MPSQAQISVTIPTLNAGRTLRDCLESLNRQGYERFETIVIDCGSTDNTLSVAQEHGASIISVSHLRLMGQIHRGVLDANGEFCLLLDADQVLAPGVLGRLANEFNAFDVVILEEHGYSPRTILSKFAELDRRVALADFARQADPRRGMLNPRYYRRSTLLTAFSRIPPELEVQSNNWNDAILYYEVSKSTPLVGFLPRAVFHQDRENWADFLRHYFTYGRNLKGLQFSAEYRELVHEKMSGRVIITRKDLDFRDRVASTIYMALKFVPHSLGYLVG